VVILYFGVEFRCREASATFMLAFDSVHLVRRIAFETGRRLIRSQSRAILEVSTGFPVASFEGSL